MGGRSLRYTATIIYACGCAEGDVADEEDDAANEDERRRARRATSLASSFISFGHEPEYFDDVGGAHLWKGLHDALKARIPRVDPNADNDDYGDYDEADYDDDGGDDDDAPW